MTENIPQRLVGGSRLLPKETEKQPLLSIILVFFRDRDEVREILSSIVPFLCDELEIVIVDGFSEDGTVEVLREFGDHIDFWHSEPDTGIYDAMNKGLSASLGTYVLHLNAGDRLLCVPWQQLRQCAKDKVDVVYGRVLLDSRIEIMSQTSFLSKLDNTWHHQGTFYRRTAHLGYDTSYATGADFDHNQRLLKSGCTIRELSTIIADHAGNGISMRETGHREIYRSVKANYGEFYLLLSKLRFTLKDLRAWLRKL
ncbi:MAG: glycosyl transferase family 2 [Acidobacteriaceae bacterium]|nr:glycosyl transferase family 2 [Acidobacteriaceae bacterium]